MRALQGLRHQGVAFAAARCGACAVALAMLVAAAPHAADATAPQVSLTFALPKEVVLHEPVMADMDLDNASSEVVLWEGDAAHMSFAATSPDGVLTGVSPSWRGEDRRHLPCMDCFVAIGPAPVAARSRRENSAAVNAWLDFPVSGRYLVAVSYTGRLETTSGIPLDVTRRFTQEVTVLPRDPEAIQAHCRQRAAEFRDHPGARVAKALSYTVDPVAIDCLADAGKKGGIFAWEIVEAFADIGGPESRRALERLSHHADPLVSSVAKGGLARIK